MCRLFAQASLAPLPAADSLLSGETSLLRQADADAQNPQTDGWGLAWFDAAGKAQVVKSGGSVTVERDRFSAAVGRAVSTIVLGHLRAASTGIPVDDSHAHPFADEGWVFAHNGTLSIHREVAAQLGPRRARLKTDSDSEVYFQQFLKHLEVAGSPSRAFEACIAENWRLWETCRSRYPDIATPYTMLNAVATDGRVLATLCHASRAGMARCGVCATTQPWSVMSINIEDSRVRVVSEPVDSSAWTRLTPPETIEVSLKSGRLDVTRRALSLSSAAQTVPEASRL